MAIVDVALVAFCEAKQEHRKIPRAISDHHAIAAATPLPFAGHALLDEAAAQIGVHQPAIGTLDRLDQARICDLFPACEPGKDLELVDRHAASLVQ